MVRNAAGWSLLAHTLLGLGSEWRDENPYRKDKKPVYEEAIRIGSSAYNQNCTRCHGLEAVSGGTAPNLRKLPIDKETDEYYQQSVHSGKVRNGNVYMPPFGGVLSREAVWAIRCYLDTRHTND